jgi:hypothetical protein
MRGAKSTRSQNKRNGNDPIEGAMLPEGMTFLTY